MLFFPAAQDCRQHTRIALAMKNGNDPYGVFVGGVDDEVIIDADEPQRAGRKVEAAVAAVLDGDKVTE